MPTTHSIKLNFRIYEKGSANSISGIAKDVERTIPQVTKAAQRAMRIATDRILSIIQADTPVYSYRGLGGGMAGERGKLRQAWQVRSLYGATMTRSAYEIFPVGRVREGTEWSETWENVVYYLVHGTREHFIPPRRLQRGGRLAAVGWLNSSWDLTVRTGGATHYGFMGYDFLRDATRQAPSILERAVIYDHFIPDIFHSMGFREVRK